MANKTAASAEKYVQEVDGAWTFQCPGPVDSLCGPVDGAPFSSSGWPDKKHAVARGVEHIAEHRDPSQVASSLEDFRAKHGLGVNASGDVVKVEDL